MRGHDGREAVRFNSSWPGIKPSFVMAGLVAQVGFTRLVPHHLIRKSGRPGLRCHPRLTCFKCLEKTWMPATSAGMTNEESPQMCRGHDGREATYASPPSWPDLFRPSATLPVLKIVREDVDARHIGVRKHAVLWTAKAGMTGERQCVSIRHGGTCRASRVYPTCASSFNSQVGQARLAVPSTSLVLQGC